VYIAAIRTVVLVAVLTLHFVDVLPVVRARKESVTDNLLVVPVDSSRLNGFCRRSHSTPIPTPFYETLALFASAIALATQRCSSAQ
jgi:hypothetical protein